MVQKVRFIYLYRDASNYKQYNDVVFGNNSNLPLRKIEKTIHEHLIDRLWFIADDLQLPNLFFDEYMWNNEVDHNWHEFKCVELTTDAASHSQDIRDFLEKLISKRYSELTSF